MDERGKDLGAIPLTHAVACPPCTCRARVRWRDVLDSAWLAHTQSVSHVEMNQVTPRISSASNGSGAGGYVVVWLRKPALTLACVCSQNVFHHLMGSRLNLRRVPQDVTNLDHVASS